MAQPAQRYLKAGPADDSDRGRVSWREKYDTAEMLITAAATHITSPQTRTMGRRRARTPKTDTTITMMTRNFIMTPLSHHGGKDEPDESLHLKQSPPPQHCAPSDRWHRGRTSTLVNDGSGRDEGDVEGVKDILADADGITDDVVDSEDDLVTDVDREGDLE